jgi:hypothetical protein
MTLQIKLLVIIHADKRSAKDEAIFFSQTKPQVFTRASCF